MNMRIATLFCTRLVALLLGLLLIVLAVMLVTRAQARADLKAQSSLPGAIMDVGGYQLHLFCEGSSSPIVIVERGKGDSSLIWSLIRPESVKTTLTCVYDRAGLGWSERSVKPRTSTTIFEELHMLLVNAVTDGIDQVVTAARK